MKKSEGTALGLKVVGLYAAFLQAIIALSAPISLHESAITLQTQQGRMGAGNYTVLAVAFIPAVLISKFPRRPFRRLLRGRLRSILDLLLPPV